VHVTCHITINSKTTGPIRFFKKACTVYKAWREGHWFPEIQRVVLFPAVKTCIYCSGEEQ
jgi:hypothetical protein